MEYRTYDILMVFEIGNVGNFWDAIIYLFHKYIEIQILLFQSAPNSQLKPFLKIVFI